MQRSPKKTKAAEIVATTMPLKDFGESYLEELKEPAREGETTPTKGETTPIKGETTPMTSPKKKKPLPHPMVVGKKPTLKKKVIFKQDITSKQSQVSCPYIILKQRLRAHKT